LFLADLRKLARNGPIGNKPESVAIRERCHHRDRRCSGHRDSGCVLYETSTHFGLSVGSHCPKNRINPVESREIEPLAPNKNISDDVPATAMNGLLWQPEQEFVSGPEIRLKFSGKPVGQRDL
jgi:hypothetical protein